ncbi:hypothetical protein GO755_01640 [Spirosoma sp. HMF4905]|uniref:Glycosyltransferase RgtA/B/C/D-like domain-containing protein n=1 Tax=Spirosoma arboris TaxID=2682092 RepID=A0A7K1S4H1_9BACT|nr:hypothetical protein [Spirosoma arboris]MVM28717.1 hypothetical protein [Spirosoma arboris]
MKLVSIANPQRFMSSRLRTLASVLIAIPILCFCVLLLIYVVDVPWIDDIDAFLSFIIGYIDAPTLGEKLDWLIRPNNEHRILMGKLITLAMYKLTGIVSYRWLIFAAFAFLLGLLVLFYRIFRSMKLPLLAFVPVVFLLLQPQYYLTSMWAITAMQHQVVIMMSFVTIYLLASDEQNRFGAALGVQVLTSLSMSNGLFGWVAGAVVLALQRQWIRLGIWLLLGVGTIVFYFHDFPDGQGNESSVSFFLKYPYLVFLGFFTFTGGLFDFFSRADILWRSVLPTLAGFVIILTMLGLLWRMNEPRLGRRIGAYESSNRATRALWKRRYFFTGCYAFLMVNAVIVAFLRPRFGYEVMLISNYMIYPAVLVILIYLNILSERQTELTLNRWVGFGLLISLVIWSNWYVVQLPKIAYRKHQMLTYAFNQKHNKTGLGPSWGSSFLALAERTMNETIRRGIYAYPEAYYTPYESQLVLSQQMKPDTSLHINVLGGGYSYIAETNYNALPQPIDKAAIVIQSAQRTYLFPSELPYTFINYYLNRPIRTIQAEIINPTVAPGHYRIGILSPLDGKNPIRFSRQTVTVPTAIEDSKR